jgi:L,D-transpeptidase YbiS
LKKINVTRRIFVDLKEQSLKLSFQEDIVREFEISTSKFGPGQEKGSFKTPTGHHIIRAKIGAGAPGNAIFKGRRWRGDTYPLDGIENLEEDHILARILWLSGLEKGINRLGNVDTMQRYIYIHGSPDKTFIGQPSSIGCIRMLPSDVMELFDLVEVGDQVQIV